MKNLSTDDFELFFDSNLWIIYMTIKSERVQKTLEINGLLDEKATVYGL